MERATDTSFFATYDDLKKNRHCQINNIFLDSQELSQKINERPCYFHKTENSLFLLLPSHEDMGAMYFISANGEAFDKDLASFLPQAARFPKIKTSLIGKEENCLPILSTLKDNNFALIKKLLRMRLGVPDDKIVSAMGRLAPDYKKMASFAEVGDAEEILSLICEEFDLVGDNIPDIHEIRENIKNKNVTVVKNNNSIVALHYFRIKNGIAQGYFDLTRKDFRGGDGLIFALNLFERDYFTNRDIKINRSFGWRDATKTRLVKSSSKSNSFPDGIVIYNMLWTPSCSGKKTEETRT